VASISSAISASMKAITCFLGDGNAKARRSLA